MIGSILLLLTIAGVALLLLFVLEAALFAAIRRPSTRLRYLAESGAPLTRSHDADDKTRVVAKRQQRYRTQFAPVSRVRHQRRGSGHSAASVANSRDSRRL